MPSFKINIFFFTQIELEDPEAAYEEFEGMPYGDDDGEDEDEYQDEKCEDKICEKVNEDKLCKKVNEQHEEKVREIWFWFIILQIYLGLTQHQSAMQYHIAQGLSSVWQLTVPDKY